MTSRVLLQPGEQAQYFITFQPTAVGNYEHTFTLQITGLPQKYYLTCQGKCDIPTINMRPKNIFPKVVRRKTEKNMYWNNLFLLEDNVFDFGPSLLKDSEETRQVIWIT